MDSAICVRNGRISSITGVWSDKERELHINVREAMALAFAFRRWGPATVGEVYAIAVGLGRNLLLSAPFSLEKDRKDRKERKKGGGKSFYGAKRQRCLQTPLCSRTLSRPTSTLF